MRPLLMGICALLLQGCATTTLIDSTSSEEAVTWSRARVADVAVDHSGTVHVVVEADDGEFYVFGAHRTRLAEGLTRCQVELDGGRLPDHARCKKHLPPAATIESDESGRRQLVLAPADGSRSSRWAMAATTRTRGAGGWVAVALLSPITLTIDVAMTAKEYASPVMILNTVVDWLIPDFGSDETKVTPGCTCEHPHDQ